jgi:LysM repeat protein
MRFQLFTSRLGRTSLFIAVVLTLMLASLPTGVMAAPATSHDYGDDHGCGGDCYIVQPGDTLSEIAKWYHVSLWELARYNHISNPSTIYIGQKLRIPDGRCGDDCGGYHKPDYDKGCDGCDGHDGGYDKPDYGKGCDGCDGYGHGGYDKKYDEGHDNGGYHNADWGHQDDCCDDYHKSDYGKGCDGCDSYGHDGYGHDGYDKKYDDGYGHDGYDKKYDGCGGCGGHGDGRYVVQPGDTLSQIAKWYHVSVDYLCHKNGISNPSKIYVGQVIWL